MTSQLDVVISDAVDVHLHIDVHGFSFIVRTKLVPSAQLVVQLQVPVL